MERLLAVGGKWKGLSGEEWRWVVRRAVAFKASIVERDERETSLRRILNLGHTIGHAMENSGGYGRLLHGEAVAMGWPGRRSSDEARRDRRGIGRRHRLPPHRHGVSPRRSGVALTSIAAAIGMDKKRRMSDVDLPLVAAPAVASCGASPCGDPAGTARIRAEIRERSIARELNIPAAMWPRKSPGFEPRSARGEVYEIRSVEETAAPAVPAVAGSVVREEPAAAVGPESDEEERPAGPEPERAPTGTRAASIVRTVTWPTCTGPRENIPPRGGSSGRSSATTPRTSGPGVVGGPDRRRSRGGGSPRVPRDHAKEYGYDLS